MSPGRSAAHIKTPRTVARGGARPRPSDCGPGGLDPAQGFRGFAVLCPLRAFLGESAGRKNWSTSSEAVEDAEATSIYLSVDEKILTAWRMFLLSRKDRISALSFFQTYFWELLRPLLIKHSSSDFPPGPVFPSCPAGTVPAPPPPTSPGFGGVLELSLWVEGTRGSVCQTPPPAHCHFGLNPTPRGELEPSPRACRSSRSWSPLKPPAGIPIAKGPFLKPSTVTS